MDLLYTQKKEKPLNYTTSLETLLIVNDTKSSKSSKSVGLGDLSSIASS